MKLINFRIQTIAVILTFIGMINCTLIKLSIKNFHNDGALYFLIYSIFIDFALFEHPLHCIVLCATCIKAQLKMKIKLYTSTYSSIYWRFSKSIRFFYFKRWGMLR